MDVKQVIVMRRDLKMRRGKEIVQGGHAAMWWLLDRIQKMRDSELELSEAERQWVEGGCKKICCQVEGEKELLELYQACLRGGLTAHLVVDHGLTEFGGVPTTTALAIGPCEAAGVDAVTGELRLY